MPFARNMLKVVSRTNLVKGAAGDTATFVTHAPGPSLRDGLGSVSDRIQPTQPLYNNNFAPPSVAFASGNPYLDRPLPAPPSRKAKMPERPNTSGGPNSKSKATPEFNFDKFDKRVSRDDFYLGTKPVVGLGIQQQYTPFRGQLPTPEGSPRSRSHTLPTPESMNDSGSVPIGMALGSPTQQPADWGPWAPNQTLRPAPAQARHPVSPLSIASSVDSYDMPKEKKQPGRWKLFGMFGRKQVEPTQPVISISDPNELAGTLRPEQALPRPQLEPEAKPSRSNTTTNRKAPKHKPIVVRSNTMPHKETQYQSPSFSQATKRQPSIDTLGSSNVYGRSTSNFGSIPIALDPSPPALKQAATPLLNVEIPQSSMERYSVMFGSVLQTQPSNASALLARRQATLRELKSISESVIKEEQEEKLVRPRRGTSPQPTKSPAFALFPSTPSSRQTTYQTPLHPSRLARSHTSPALLPSPSKASFDRPSPNNFKDTNQSTTSSRGRLAVSTLERARERHLAPQDFQFGPAESGLILESPTDFEDSESSPEIIKNNTVRPLFQEPEWQMINPSQTAPSTSSSVNSSRKQSPSSVSSIKTHVTKPSVDLDEPNNINMNPVEISIARQISISRQQRKMLQPLQTSFTATKPRRSPEKTSPMPMIAMGKNERLAETKSATPTLVTPVETLNSQLAQHRKSERIILET